MIRTFLALPLDEATRAALADEIGHLRTHAPKVKWVRPESLHLTLKFLGNLPEADLPEVFEATDAAAEEVAPYSLHVEGLGCFPHPGRMRTVWAGCGAGRDETVRLAGAVEEAFEAVGYERERRAFHPHVTLGRVKVPRDAAALPDPLADGARQGYGIVDVDAVAVMMSELKRSGARYTVMHHAPLGPRQAGPAPI